MQRFITSASLNLTTTVCGWTMRSVAWITDTSWLSCSLWLPSALMVFYSSCELFFVSSNNITCGIYITLTHTTSHIPSRSEFLLRLEGFYHFTFNINDSFWCSLHRNNLVISTRSNKIWHCIVRISEKGELLGCHNYYVHIYRIIIFLTTGLIFI